MAKTIKEKLDFFYKKYSKNEDRNNIFPATHCSLTMTLHQQQVLFKVLNDYESEIANKDKLIKSQAYDCSEYLKIIKRNADERQTQLKKSDFEYYYDCEYCVRLSEGQQCEKSYYDNECFRYHDETHILIALKDNSKYESLED